MLVTIKPHSSLQSYFIGGDISINLDSYSEVLDYLAVMQPAFIYYTKQLIAEGLQESFVFLDENLNEIPKEDLLVKRFKDDTTIHIVPVVMGGGGKRGGVLAILAAAALFVIAPYIAPTLAGVIPGATVEGVKLAIISQAVGLAISGLSAVLMKAPSAPKNADSARVENNMFSSLKNTIDSGTFVPINYGMPRVAGHLVTGYIKTINHPKGFKVSVSDVIGFNSALYNSTLAAQSGFITIPTSSSVISLDGLVMYIDPANPGSYSGSGTAIADLASDQQGAIIGDVELDNFAFKLNGGYIDMGKSYVSATEINNTDKLYTIEFWTKVPQTITSGDVISNGALGVDLSLGSAQVVKTVGQNDTQVFQTRYYADFSSINTTDALNNRAILNKWLHIVYTLNGTNLKTYLNGRLRAEDTVTSSITSPTNLLIGSAGLSSSYIGLARLYNTELSAEQVTKNFNSEKARFETSSNSSFILPTTQVVNNDRR